MTTTTPETKLSQPTPADMPDEVWGLWNDDTGDFVKAFDHSSDNAYLMFFNPLHAELAAEYHRFEVPGCGGVFQKLLWRKGVG